jgi:SsrA-binding protein
MTQPSRKPAQARRVVARNRRASHDFELGDRFEAGMLLLGTEVKGLRHGHVSLDQAWARVSEGEVWLCGLHIAEGPGTAPPPRQRRERKLLLHRREIRKIENLLHGGGRTLVPLELVFNERGFAKLLFAVGTGRKKHDKRQRLREKSSKAEIRNALRRR